MNYTLTELLSVNFILISDEGKYPKFTDKLCQLIKVKSSEFYTLKLCNSDYKGIYKIHPEYTSTIKAYTFNDYPERFL